MSLSQSAKFRPVLTSQLISHICDLARRDGSDMSLHVLAALSSFEWKIKSGAVTPAYTPTPKESLSSSLGFHETVQEVQKVLSDEALYAMWANDPSSLNTEQLKKVRTYRYTNNKMTVEEERTYETEVMGFDVGEGT